MNNKYSGTLKLRFNRLEDGSPINFPQIDIDNPQRLSDLDKTIALCRSGGKISPEDAAEAARILRDNCGYTGPNQSISDLYVEDSRGSE